MISDHKRHILIFSIQHKQKSLYRVNFHLCQCKLLHDYVNMGGRGENIMQNLDSCQKVIPRHYIMIETANKIISKQNKSVC